MKRFTSLFILIILILILIVDTSFCQSNLKVWAEFVSMLKKDDFPPEKIRPYPGLSKEPKLEFLNDMRKKATWQEWENDPEIHRVENQLHFLIPLTFDGNKVEYCFSFLIENDTWYFQHLEGITIRVDKIGSLPTSEFPDLPEWRKAWMREEIQVSTNIRLFNLLALEKGKEFAYNWFKDGYGYAIGARTWVPFFPLPKAFILYLCWIESRLYANGIVLEKLEENEAVVRMEPIYFWLYKKTGHLKRQVSFDDYKELFETIWQDRAEKAGWTLQIEYKGDECWFYFKKK